MNGVRMMNVRSSAVRGMVAGLVLFPALAACGGGDEEAAALEQAAPQVVVLGAEDVALARISDVAPTVLLTGTLEPLRKADVKSQAPGTITELRVDRGQRVSAGQTLATIAAEGIVSQAAGAAAAVSGAQANLALAQRQLDSSKRLYEAGAGSEMDYRAAQAQVAAARSQVAAARAQATGASESAARTRVTSPISGVVSDRVVNPGEAVTNGQKLLTVVNSEVLELVGQIPVQVAAQVKVGQPVNFTLDAYPGQQFTGRVARIDPTADPATRKVGTALQLPNPGGRIVGGQFVTGQIQVRDAPPSVVVPQAALRGEEGAHFVFVVQGDRLVRRNVTAGTVDEAHGMVAIQTGIQSGDRVVVSPASDITDGTRVRLAAPAANGGAR